MELSSEAVSFQAEDGAVVVYPDGFGWEVLFSPDGEKFFKLHRTGFGGSSEKHHISYEDPHRNRRGDIYREGNQLTMDGKVFKKVGNRPEVDPIPLPIVRVPEYLFLHETSGDVYIYVSADKYNNSYESFKLFIGNGDNMRELPVRHVERYRDGGTTYIETDEGTLFSPTPFDQDAKATWNQRVLVGVDPLGYDISETELGVFISLREQH